jgi:hypothetical protein
MDECPQYLLSRGMSFSLFFKWILTRGNTSGEILLKQKQTNIL